MAKFENRALTLQELCKEHRMGPTLMRRAISMAGLEERRMTVKDIPALRMALISIRTGEPLRRIRGKIVEHRMVPPPERAAD